MEKNLKLNAIVIGATGMTGCEVVELLLKSPFYSKVTIFVRRTIERWDTLPLEQSSKLNIIKVDSLDFLSEGKDRLRQMLNDSAQYHVLFCCLGSRVGKGEDEFRKVDFTYTVQSCEMCEKLEIPHFSNISANTASKTSTLLYSRTKGEADEENLKKNVNYITVFRPGYITDKNNNSKTAQTIGKYIPNVHKINVSLLALALIRNDIEYQLLPNKNDRKAVILEHKEIEAIANRKE